MPGLGSVVAIEPWVKRRAENLLLVLDFTGILASSETLDGTPAIAVTLISGDASSDSSDDLAAGNLSSIAVNTGTITRKDGSTVAVGKAVQFVAPASKGVAGQDYKLTVTCNTSVSGRIREGVGILKFR